MLKNIKNLLVVISLIAIVIMPVIVLAGDIPDIKTLLDETAGVEGAGFDTDPQLAQTGIATVVGTVARVVLSLMGVLFITYVIVGGWMWMSAAGNEEKISKAKKTLRDGIIGLIIVLSAASIYWLVKTALLIGSSSDFPSGS